MEPEKRPEEETEQMEPHEEKKPYEPYSKKTRLLAWGGVAFMVFLVIMYTYSLASGKIMAW